MIIISLDLSINGTGVTVFDTVTKEYEFLAFPNANKIRFETPKTPKSSIFLSNDKLKYNLSVYMVEQKDELEINKLIRISELIFINTIYHYYKVAQERNDEIMVCMEEQVMSAFKSSAMIQIGEFNGMIKYMMYKNCNVVPYLINNRTCKKHIVGNGNAKKEDVYAFFIKDEFLSPIITDIVKQSDIRVYGTFLEDVIDSYMLLKYFQKFIIKQI
jgi:Holliday junction resolvasome RuvABC endonuclease subunit